MMSAGAMASESTVMVGGAAMYPSKNIIENAVNSKDHTTLVAAVKAADLVDALSGKGPFTVFAPVNAAFTALPAGTVETLLKPENKDQLTKILTAHVVAGDISAQDLMTKGKDKNGYAMKTLSGDVLVAFNRGGYVYIVDENGGSAKVTISDVNQSNGVIHVVNKVLLPK
ncbi:fasciclin domain-containing protein [Mariluticola halotolerans]|nr:fasciclin domain-containing protein [Mariluticola halotolerans]UJQ96003.1 fasciclin domain-containing protein [Mariluticola halotolerans]